MLASMRYNQSSNKISHGNNCIAQAQLVGGGHTKTETSSTTFSSVVSRDSVRVALTIAALNKLDILACDIKNAYLKSLFRENIWKFAGTEFGEEEGTLMLVKTVLYGLQSSGAAF